MATYRESGWNSEEGQKATALALSILIHAVALYMAATSSLNMNISNRAAPSQIMINLVPFDSNAPVEIREPGKEAHPLPPPQRDPQAEKITAFEETTTPPPPEKPVRKQADKELKLQPPPENLSGKMTATVIPAPYSRPLRRTVTEKAQPTPEKPDPQQQAARQQNITATPPATPATATAARGDEPGSSRKAAAQRMGLIRLSISRLIAKNFVYPSAARRRNWQGRVVVEIYIEPSGRFSQVMVVESSGFSIRDRAATKTVNKLGQLPDTLAMGLEKPVHLRLPIIYRLEG